MFFESPHCLCCLGPLKPSPAFPSFSSLALPRPPSPAHLLPLVIVHFSSSPPDPHDHSQVCPQNCCCFPSLHSHPSPTPFLMLFSCFLRFSFSCSFPFLQRQDVEEGQQRAKSTRAMSLWVSVTDVCDLGQRVETLLWVSVIPSVDGVGSPMPGIQCRVLCQYWWHGHAKKKTLNWLVQTY